METIPTAEEYLIANAEVYTEDFYYSEIVVKNDVLDTKETITNVMIEFAKLHVIEALKQASEKAILIIMLKENTDELSMCDDWSYSIVDQISILNAYSLDNIK